MAVAMDSQEARRRMEEGRLICRVLRPISEHDKEYFYRD